MGALELMSDRFTFRNFLKDFGLRIRAIAAAIALYIGFQKLRG